jgi:predicted PurR-regulated permease PerM
MELRQAAVLDPPEAEAPPEPPPRRGVPGSLVTASELGWRFLVVVAAIAVLAYGLWYVRLVALPAFVALLLATVLVPPMQALRRRGLRPGAATAIVFVGTLLVAIGVLSLIVPPFASEVGTLSDTITGGAHELGRLIASGPFGLDRGDVQSAIDSLSDRLHASGGEIASGVLSGAVIAGQIAAGILLTLVLLFFYVKDGPRLWAWAVRMFPENARDRVDDGRRSWWVLGAYVRGQALVATVDAVFIGIGLAILGLPLVLPLAVLIFVAAFVPIVGAFTAGAAAVLIALVSKGAGVALVVLGLNLVVQQVEGNVLYPVIMRRTIELHPVATLLAVGAGGVLAGIIGALVAVPIVAVVATALPILRGEPPPRGLEPAR